MAAQSFPPVPDDVLLAVQGVTRAEPRPEPQLPRWLVRVLPESGLAGQWGGPDVDVEDDPDDEDGLVGDLERAALREIDFELRAGEGLGLVGPDTAATQTLIRILTRAIPPTTGRVVIRGRIAPLVKRDLGRYTGTTKGWNAVMVVAKFLHWPRALLNRRREQIFEFACLHELEEDRESHPRRFRNHTVMRLLWAAALHMDASVYVLDEGIPSDDEYGARCFDLLAQRQREGAAVVQRAETRVEDVARFCQRVLWIEKGAVRFRGSPVEVAVAAEEGRREELHPLSVPVRATLVAVGPEGAHAEIALEVMRKELELAFTLQLVGEDGRSHELTQPEPYWCDAPGVHSLRVSLPGGALAAGRYEATLLARLRAIGGEQSEPRELLTFEVVASGRNGSESGADEVEWDVSRTAA